jgi:hypothetical protein
MFDSTDLEIARREHAYEMGSESRRDQSWSRFYHQAETVIIANGWDGKFDNGKSRGLDGNEYTADGEPSDGYSIDGAYEAWEAHWSVERYIARVAVRRAELGL